MRFLPRHSPVAQFYCRPFQGRRPGGGLGGTVPPKNSRWGDGPCIGPPPIFWEAVLLEVRESMNRVKNCVFLVRKWWYTTFNIVNIRKRKGKSKERGRWLKKKVIRNLRPSRPPAQNLGSRPPTPKIDAYEFSWTHPKPTLGRNSLKRHLKLSFFKPTLRQMHIHSFIHSFWPFL